MGYPQDPNDYGIPPVSTCIELSHVFHDFRVRHVDFESILPLICQGCAAVLLDSPPLKSSDPGVFDVYGIVIYQRLQTFMADC